MASGDTCCALTVRGIQEPISQTHIFVKPMQIAQCLSAVQTWHLSHHVIGIAGQQGSRLDCHCATDLALQQCTRLQTTRARNAHAVVDRVPGREMLCNHTTSQKGGNTEQMRPCTLDTNKATAGSGAYYTTGVLC